MEPTWEQQYDEGSGYFYYINSLTQETTWDEPPGFQIGSTTTFADNNYEEKYNNDDDGTKELYTEDSYYDFDHSSVVEGDQDNLHQQHLGGSSVLSQPDSLSAQSQQFLNASSTLSTAMSAIPENMSTTLAGSSALSAGTSSDYNYNPDPNNNNPKPSRIGLKSVKGINPKGRRMGEFPTVWKVPTGVLATEKALNTSSTMIFNDERMTLIRINQWTSKHYPPVVFVVFVGPHLYFWGSLTTVACCCLCSSLCVCQVKNHNVIFSVPVIHHPKTVGHIVILFLVCRTPQKIHICFRFNTNETLVCGPNLFERCWWTAIVVWVRWLFCPLLSVVFDVCTHCYFLFFLVPGFHVHDCLRMQLHTESKLVDNHKKVVGGLPPNNSLEFFARYAPQSGLVQINCQDMQAPDRHKITYKPPVGYWFQKYQMFAFACTLWNVQEYPEPHNFRVMPQGQSSTTDPGWEQCYAFWAFDKPYPGMIRITVLQQVFHPGQYSGDFGDPKQHDPKSYTKKKKSKHHVEEDKDPGPIMLKLRQVNADQFMYQKFSQDGLHSGWDLLYDFYAWSMPIRGTTRFYVQIARNPTRYRMDLDRALPPWKDVFTFYAYLVDFGDEHLLNFPRVTSL